MKGSRIWQKEKLNCSDGQSCSGVYIFRRVHLWAEMAWPLYTCCNQSLAVDHSWEHMAWLRRVSEAEANLEAGDQRPFAEVFPAVVTTVSSLEGDLGIMSPCP